MQHAGDGPPARVRIGERRSEDLALGRAGQARCSARVRRIRGSVRLMRGNGASAGRGSGSTRQAARPERRSSAASSWRAFGNERGRYGRRHPCPAPPHRTGRRSTPVGRGHALDADGSPSAVVSDSTSTPGARANRRCSSAAFDAACECGTQRSSVGSTRRRPERGAVGQRGVRRQRRASTGERERRQAAVVARRAHGRLEHARERRGEIRGVAIRVLDRGHRLSRQLWSRRSIRVMPPVGPQVPAGYGFGAMPVARQPSRIGSTHCHAASSFVAAHEQGGVAAHHVDQQALVGVRRSAAEGLLEGDVEVRRAQAHAAGAGVLGHHLELDALLRLQAGSRAGSARVRRTRRGRSRSGEAAELHDDLGELLGQPLAGAQVEGHAGPAPGLHLELEGHEGLGAAGPRCQIRRGSRRPACRRWRRPRTGRVRSLPGRRAA